MSNYEFRRIGDDEVLDIRSIIDIEPFKQMALRCSECEARVHIHKFRTPREDYYVALNPDQDHTSICELFEEEGNDRPVITKGPDDLWSSFCAPAREAKRTKASTSEEQEPDNDHGVEKTISVKKVTGIDSFIKGGYFAQSPFDNYIDGKYQLIDYIVFRNWAEYIFDKTHMPDTLGFRAVEVKSFLSYDLRL